MKKDEKEKSETIAQKQEEFERKKEEIADLLRLWEYLQQEQEE
jgi:hypothetical protein